MTIIASIDGPNRRIYLHLDTVGVDFHPMDMYREMRALRKADETLRKYDAFLAAFGNVPKGGGKYTERYVQCLLGTRVVPYDADHIVNVIGVIITDDGQEGIACFDRTLLTATTHVDINYVPPQVEVVRAEAELAAILQMSYRGAVTIDQANGYAGTGYAPNGFPIGTTKAPSNNVTDGDWIVDDTGLNTLSFVTSYTFNNETFGSKHHIMQGSNVMGVMLNIDAATNVANIDFRDIILTGYLDTANIVRDAIVLETWNVNGFVYNSVLSGPLHVNANTSIQSCWIAPDAPSRTVVIDLGGNPVSLLISDWSVGHIHLTNMVTGCFVGCVGEGIVSVDVSCTGGILNYGGAIKLNTDSEGQLDMVVDLSTSQQTYEKHGDLAGSISAVDTKINDNNQFRGLDPLNPVARSGDGVTEEVLTVDGKVLTITPTDITRT